MTYSERLITAQDFAILWIDNDLQLLHALGTVREQGGEHLFEAVLDGEQGLAEGNLGVCDICNASWCAWNEFVPQFLQSRERPKEIRLNEYNCIVAASNKLSHL